MAYLYKSAFARKRTTDATWEEIDLTAIPIPTLYTNYFKVWVVLTNPLFGTQSLYLDLDLLRTRIGLLATGITFPQWLATLGNQALPTTIIKPSTAETPAMYKDAWLAGYDIATVDHMRSLTEVIPEADKPDLLLTKPAVDYNYFETNALVSVNGFFHRHGASSDGVYVMGGAKSWRRGNDNRVGILSFAKVAPLSIVPLTAEMIYKSAPGQQMGNYAYVNLGQSVVGKTVLFVLGGYLHVLDETYLSVGDGLYRINFNKYPLIQRIIESGKVIDLSSLSLDSTTNNPDQVGVANIYSDSVLTAYLTLSQSFAVIVDTPQIYARRYQLESTLLPGRYFGYTPRGYPLLINHGEVAEYNCIPQDGMYVYAVANNLMNQYRFLTTEYRKLLSLDSSRLSDRPVVYSPGYLLEVGRYD